MARSAAFFSPGAKRGLDFWTAPSAMKALLSGAASAYDLSATCLQWPVFADDDWRSDWQWVASSLWDGIDAFESELTQLHPGQGQLFDVAPIESSKDG